MFLLVCEWLKSEESTEVELFWGEDLHDLSTKYSELNRMTHTANMFKFNRMLLAWRTVRGRLKAETRWGEMLYEERGTNLSCLLHPEKEGIQWTREQKQKAEFKSCHREVCHTVSQWTENTTERGYCLIWRLLTPLCTMY